ncbi:MAG TPA: DNA recombination protein RmuC [Myxococcota bacterium]|nr:DNA recombination protein RmuC [Myxococcota bacterium]
MPAIDLGALGPWPLAAAALVAGAAAVALLAWWLVRRSRRREAAAEAARAQADAARAAEVAALRESFAALSADALQRNNQSFLDLARASLGEFQRGAASELEKRQQAVDALVAPIRDSLERMGEKLGAIEKERHGHYSALVQQLRQVSADHSKLQVETSGLVRALRTAPARGRWGELQLRRVVELAGMLEHCDFALQETLGVERRLRPDLVVRLPGGKRVVVDAKAPLEAYLDAHETVDEAAREVKLKDHARQVRSHVTSLGEKAYWNELDEAPDFVVLFLPGEPFFAAALQYDATLVEYAADRRVVLASPTTLIALLRAVHHGWQQERIAEEAQRVARLGRELYERVATLGGHLERLGKSLDRAVTAYNEAVGSVETRVLVTARRLKELAPGPGADELPGLEPVQPSARRLQAPAFDEGTPAETERT